MENFLTKWMLFDVAFIIAFMWSVHGPSDRHHDLAKAAALFLIVLFNLVMLLVAFLML